MKFILGVILSLALLELFHCAPLIGSEDGTYTETHTSNSWGYNAGLDANFGLKGGYKDGHGTLGTVNHLGVNIGGHKENSQKDLKHAVPAAPPPNNFGSGSGSPYYIQYAPQPAPQNPPQGAPQVSSQYTQQWPQYGPQQALQVDPQYAPQYAYAPLYAPQYPPQAAPQYAPQYIPQGTAQYAPQGAPYYAPQSAPPY